MLMGISSLLSMKFSPTKQLRENCFGKCTALIQQLSLFQMALKKKKDKFQVNNDIR